MKNKNLTALLAFMAGVLITILVSQATHKDEPKDKRDLSSSFEQRDMFPYWREADSVCGVEYRGTDLWLTIAIDTAMFMD